MLITPAARQNNNFMLYIYKTVQGGKEECWVCSL
uniref:Uncharacterized protein n=1 Tax=Rhizophora mucronata TaxID=61149 RepID=A0A2P2N6B1_RHIMU